MVKKIHNTKLYVIVTLFLNCSTTVLTMHLTIGLTDYYWTISDGLTG